MSDETRLPEAVNATAHPEIEHVTGRIGWLRAAVLGANDGLISTSSLLIGVAAADAAREPVLVAGVAGLVAGAISMAAGEYVSVSSQADTERAELAFERHSLLRQPELERAELGAIYVARGLSPELARQVAQELMEHDALAAHARDELGLTEALRARPLQAALASAVAFAAGALPPVLVAAWAPLAWLSPAIAGGTLALLVLLGGSAARLGRAPAARGALRVVFWGAVAMAGTALAGRLVGAAL
jgi:VIT1/CCC1 family predicted Fe2+/Mn2+ transporter